MAKVYSPILQWLICPWKARLGLAALLHVRDFLAMRPREQREGSGRPCVGDGKKRGSSDPARATGEEAPLLPLTRPVRLLQASEEEGGRGVAGEGRLAQIWWRGSPRFHWKGAASSLPSDARAPPSPPGMARGTLDLLRQRKEERARVGRWVGIWRPLRPKTF
jgi:hypothetical protein